MDCSVRYYLLPLEEQERLADAPSFRPKLSVQLESRHWVMRDSRGQIYDRVDGAGVIGLHPILTPGEPFPHKQYQISVQF